MDVGWACLDTMINFLVSLDAGSILATDQDHVGLLEIAYDRPLCYELGVVYHLYPTSPHEILYVSGIAGIGGTTYDHDLVVEMHVQFLYLPHHPPYS